MLTSFAAEAGPETIPLALSTACEQPPARPLADDDRAEVLDFLAARPLHTFIMAGYVLDHGVVSSHHRGAFYACRNAAGTLEGVAFVGRKLFFETRTEAALRALARVAQGGMRPDVVMAEAEQAGRFWDYFAAVGQAPNRIRHALLFEQHQPDDREEAAPALRRARPEDFEQVIRAHAQMTWDETRVNPLSTDAEGFRERCARRIDRGRTWVWISEGRLVFKADVMIETPGVVYIEGVYVHPAERRRGYALRGMAELSRHLLNGSNSLCLFVDEKNRAAQGLYQKLGYKLRGRYSRFFCH